MKEIAALDGMQPRFQLVDVVFEFLQLRKRELVVGRFPCHFRQQHLSLSTKLGVLVVAIRTRPRHDTFVDFSVEVYIIGILIYVFVRPSL